MDGFKAKNVFLGKRHKRAKRNSSGVSVLTRLELTKFIKIVGVTADHLIWLKICKSLTGYPLDTYICCSYIPPNNSPFYTSHKDVNLFDLLSRDISKFSKLGHIMVKGDLNSRVGTKSDVFTEAELHSHGMNLPDEHVLLAPNRCSMDAITNTWGNHLIDLCFAHNLCLLNGRTLGDLDGCYTYYSPSGNSVIDVTLVDKQILCSALLFKVHDLTEYTSHCKIETILACKPIPKQPTESCTAKMSFCKYIWHPETSPDKLAAALSSIEFSRSKQKLLETNYSNDAKGVDALTSDVERLTNFLHERSCEKVNLGRKSKFKRKRQPWFTPSCQLIRERVRRAANFLSRNPFNRQARDEYFIAKRSYVRLIKKSKKQYKENSVLKLLNSVDKQELWSLLSEMRGKSSDTPITMSELYTHFNEVLNTPQKEIPENILNFLKNKVTQFVNEPVTQKIDGLKMGEYTPNSLVKIAKSLKNEKSAFIDGTINEVIKHSISNTSQIFCKLFNLIETSSEFPTSWKSSFLVPLHKKGSAGDPNNYRGLAVGSNTSKFYTKTLNYKLKQFCDANNILSPNQFGFRDDHRTHDAIFVLKSIVSIYKQRNNKPVYACFVDFSKAFDSVIRSAMFFKLGQLGITGGALKLITSIYSHSEHIIKSGGSYSIPLPSKLGVKQGCNLSPLLFNLFVNDIHAIFDETCAPVDLNNWKISSLSFADDLVILSESPEGLENSIACLESYCNCWGLKVNASKYKVVVFNKRFNNKIKNLKFSIDNNQIELSKSYCYLGVEMSCSGSFQQATESLRKKALRALHSIYSSINIYSDTSNAKLF